LDSDDPLFVTIADNQMAPRRLVEQQLTYQKVIGIASNYLTLPSACELDYIFPLAFELVYK